MNHWITRTCSNFFGRLCKETPLRNALLDRFILGIAFVLSSVSDTLAWEQFAYHHVNVLGTNLELRLECSQAESAASAETVALVEIDRLAKIFSSYDSQSEMNRWIEDGEEAILSKELTEVLKACDRWHSRTNGISSSTDQVGIVRSRCYNMGWLEFGMTCTKVGTAEFLGAF